ncbi:2,3-bisphosphoglycerate-independent phosphoglycerate mutase [Clostridia bacterium]|nr:2,3-bisphosphoglycerate-independent phosphoglycerate mutase [Clostridia bacterium]
MEQNTNDSIKRRPSMIVILDGWGDREETFGNAVALAKTPVLDALWEKHPHTLIDTSGLAVGLPEGQMGNSEVGHLNIGAGRTVYQSLTRVTKSIKDGDFFENSALVSAMENAKGAAAATAGMGHSLHLMGLVSPGGVHSHTDHLLALVRMAKDRGVRNIYVHAFLDGRDTPPRSAEGYLEQLEADLAEIGAGRIVLISGRYYAMDRDNRWDRVELAYDALTLGTGISSDSSSAAIRAAYERGEDDEFVKPTNMIGADGEIAVVRDGDSVVFFNFRPDRARELTRVFTEPEFAGFARKVFPQDLNFVTMTEYDATLSHVHIAFPPEDVRNTLGEYLAALGLKQLRIAETEKYAHVTFFFNGGVEAPNPNEDRVLIPSPKVATYDLQPEMSAGGVTDRVVQEIEGGVYDAIILNFANMDMVGHTGILEAAIKAVEAVDTCVGRVVAALEKAGGQMLLTADHGNSEEVLTEDGRHITAHTTNPVRLILIRDDDAGLVLAGGGALSDLAPTLLDMMELPKPAEMTGHSLVEKKQ